MSDKMNMNEFIITSIEEEEYIKKDFRKAFTIIALSAFSSLIITAILYFI